MGRVHECLAVWSIFAVSVTGCDEEPNEPPQAVISGSNAARVGTAMTLDGSGSRDPEGGTLSYSWSITLAPDGSTATIAGATSEMATFTPDVVGPLTIELVVSDGEHEATATREYDVVEDDDGGETE
jgi:hypothetical protein